MSPPYERIDNTELCANIWKIDRFAIHDGPGIRSNLYFKGCPLRCLWCSNPEGQRQGAELGVSEIQCTGCGLCLTSCQRNAIGLQNGFPLVNMTKCDFCGQCASICPANAIHIYKGTCTLSQIMDVIERDRHIYRRSGGGITCSGGEPLLQVEFVRRLMAKCHEEGIHTAVETCGCVSESDFRAALVNIDWLYFDLKHIDNEEHRRLTGKDNRNILHNLRIASSFLGEKRKVLVIRQVVVPGLNDEGNIRKLAELAGSLDHLNYIELLPYHNYGMDKYPILRRKYQLEKMISPSDDKLKEYSEIIRSYGITCILGP